VQQAVLLQHRPQLLLLDTLLVLLQDALLTNRPLLLLLGPLLLVLQAVLLPHRPLLLVLDPPLVLVSRPNGHHTPPPFCFNDDMTVKFCCGSGCGCGCSCDCDSMHCCCSEAGSYGS
jgi:hypothetical protein